jgi:hypothetical protein
MHKDRMGLLVIPIAMALASGVHAASGTQDTPMKDVTIGPNPSNTAHSIASGAIHATRINGNPAIAAKEIGCSAITIPDEPGLNAGVSVTCFASITRLDAQGKKLPPVQLTCVSEDADLALVVANINVDSVVEFETIPKVGPAFNNCLSITVSNGSTHWQVPHD